MTNHSSPVKETDLLARLRDFVAAESKRWINFSTGDLHSIEVSPAGKLVQEAVEAIESAKTALKPCPFCDGLPTFRRIEGARPLFIISCKTDNCPANPRVSGDTEAEVAEDWNTRAAPTVTRPDGGGT